MTKHTVLYNNNPLLLHQNYNNFNFVRLLQQAISLYIDKYPFVAQFDAQKLINQYNTFI